jgi:hypothetical protein
MDNNQTKLPKVPEKALEALKNGIQSVLDSKDWVGFLSAIKQIHDYSFNNRLLIMFEQSKREWSFSPFVAGRTKWNEKFNRQLKEGEFTKPIWILAPVLIDKLDENGNKIMKPDGTPYKVPIRFRGVKVYDHRQTHGDPIPEPDTSTMMTNLDGTVSPSIMEGMCSLARQRNIEVWFVPGEDLGGALGRCWFANQGRANKIEISEDLNKITQVSVMAHELGHAILHNRDEYQEHDSSSIKELEAESVAYLVCSHYGVDLGGRSFQYIVHHNVASDDVVADLLKSGDRIFRAYQEIITTTDQFMRQEQPQRELVAA